jgi:hypothetical protein
MSNWRIGKCYRWARMLHYGHVEPEHRERPAAPREFRLHGQLGQQGRRLIKTTKPVGEMAAEISPSDRLEQHTTTNVTDHLVDRRRHAASESGPVNSVRGVSPSARPVRPACPTVFLQRVLCNGTGVETAVSRFGLSYPQLGLAAGEQGIWAKDTSE